MSRRPRAGTPALEYVKVRLTATEKEQLDRLAALTGRTRSDLIRDFIKATLMSLDGVQTLPDRTPGEEIERQAQRGGLSYSSRFEGRSEPPLRRRPHARPRR